MSTEENKANVRRYFEEVWNQGNLAVADELVDSNFSNPRLQPPVHNLESLKQYITMNLSAFPDLQFTLEDLIAEGDKVVIRYTARGTHQGELMGIPPTGKQVTVTGIDIFRFQGGKNVEGWAEFDALGLLQQLGVIPAPGQAS